MRDIRHAGWPGLCPGVQSPAPPHRRRRGPYRPAAGANGDARWLRRYGDRSTPRLRREREVRRLLGQRRMAGRRADPPQAGSAHGGRDPDARSEARRSGIIDGAAFAGVLHRRARKQEDALRTPCAAAGSRFFRRRAGPHPRSRRACYRRAVAGRDRVIDNGRSDAGPPPRRRGVKFGPVAIAEAAGAILAHGVRAGTVTFKKGRLLTPDDVAQLTGAQVETVIAARLEPGDIGEDEAAGAIAEALCGPHLTRSAAFTGRCNLFADVAGLAVVDGDRLDRINLLSEAVTIATLPAFAPVEPRQMVATIKIIPFAAPSAIVEAATMIARAGTPILRVEPFRTRRVALIQTRLPGTKPSVLEKTVEATRARVAALGSELTLTRICGHSEAELATEIATARAQGCDPILVLGASAITDRRDVIPGAIVAQGGEIRHFGMPVDPGNLLLLAKLGDADVVGLPGCARSPKRNGFDWILQRLLADVPVSRQDIMRMGVGGLLGEIAI